MAILKILFNSIEIYPHLRTQYIRTSVYVIYVHIRMHVRTYMCIRMYVHMHIRTYNIHMLGYLGYLDTVCPTNECLRTYASTYACIIRTYVCIMYKYV